MSRTNTVVLDAAACIAQFQSRRSAVDRNDAKVLARFQRRLVMALEDESQRSEPVEVPDEERK